MSKLVILCSAAALLSGCVNGSSGVATNAPVPASYSSVEAGDFIDGYEAIKRVDYVTAERELKLVLDRNPNDPYANLAMGYVFQQTGRAAQARPLYDLAVRDGKDVYPDKHFVLADQEYGTRPEEEDTIAELAQRNIASLVAY
jgi:Tfp pilus assembly protein PilF